MHTQRRVSTLSDPTWRVAPSLEEQIISLDDDRAGDAAVGDGGGGGGRAGRRGGYRPVQELRFTTHEYLKGSGPTSLLVVVRGDATATPSEAAARADAAIGGGS